MNIYANAMHNYESQKAAQSPLPPPVPVGIVGARGYVGLDLARILLKHPVARLSACFGTGSEFSLSDYLPEISGAAPVSQSISVLPASELFSSQSALKVVFLATPAETSMELAPKLVEAGMQVIDLSGAFRLKGMGPESCLSLYREWYGFSHSAPEHVAQAEYGIVPFVPPTSSARLISNPGCYATACLMALVPLLRDRLIDPRTIVIDGKSGTSGAGRKAAENLLFTEVEGDCLPYRIGRHQHLPEIKEIAQSLSGQAIDPMFSTYLLNTRRGIIAGLSCRLSSGGSTEAVQAAYDKAFAGYPLVRVAEARSRFAGPLLSLRRVVGSARTHITFHVDGDKLYVYSCIDNLLKGAASQAIENFNRLQAIPVASALMEMEGVL